MNTRRLATQALGALTLVVLTAAVVGPTAPAAAADRGRLRVAVALPAPGFWDGTTAEAGGFEAGLALALAERLGFDGVRVVDTPFRRIVRGRFAADVAVSQVTITGARDEVVDFTGPYLVVDQAVVTAAAGPATTGDLAGLRWGALRDSTGTDTLRTVVRPTAPPAEFATESEAFAALRAGRIDAVLIDGPIAARLVADAGGVLALRQTVPTGERYGVVLPEGSPLRGRVRAAVAALVGDGTAARLATEAGIPAGVAEPDFIT